MTVMRPPRHRRRRGVREWLLTHLIRSETLNRALGRGAPDVGTVVLDRNKVFILPTGYGLALALVLLVMLIGSVNYNNNLGLAFTFLIGATMLVSMLHSFRNLAGLGFRPGRVEPVFVGQRAGFALCVHNPDDRARYSLVMTAEDGFQVGFDIAVGGHCCPDLERPTDRRGRLSLGRVAVESRYPLGIFRAWSYLEPAVTCLVYPAPGPRLPLPEAGRGDGDGERLQGPGSEDFAGLRAFRPGDSPRQIHWKSLARGMALQTREFVGAGGAELWLDWRDVVVSGTGARAGTGVEARLAQLCRWVLDAEQSGQRYGLDIPGTRIAPSRGASHCGRCLEALALFTGPNPGANPDFGRERPRS